MIAAFFHDERFTRDASGTYHGTGALPYRAFERYLRRFDRVIVVGRLGPPDRSRRTVASGEGVEFDCVDQAGLAMPGYLAAVARRARGVLARADCAIVRLPSLVGAIAAREAMRTGKPWMAEVVADAFGVMWNHGSARGKAAAVAMYLVQRHVIRRAPFAVYVTRAALQRRYPPGGEWTNASNVVIDAPRPAVLDRRLARIQARDRDAPATLGLVGSYDVGYKGHETALRAVALLEREGRPVALRCVGVGDPSRWRVLAAALGVSHRIELGGALSHGNAMLDWMDALDVLLVPSLTEGLPRALVEAMSRGLPAVGSRAGGIPELLEPVVLHRAGDHRDLARVLRALLADPAALAAQSRRNWLASGEYAAEIVERRRDALLALLEAAAAARRRDRPRGGSRAASA